MDVEDIVSAFREGTRVWAVRRENGRPIVYEGVIQEYAVETPTTGGWCFTAILSDGQEYDRLSVFATEEAALRYAARNDNEEEEVE